MTEQSTVVHSPTRSWWSGLPQEGRFLVTIAGVCAMSVALLFLFKFGIGTKSWFSDDPANWGQFSDYFGGIVNPIISMATLVGVWTAVRLQREELREAGRALGEQNAQIIEQNRINTHQYVAQLFFSHLQGVQTAIAALRVEVNHNDERRTLAGEDALLAKANYFRRHPLDFFEREEDPGYKTALLNSLDPLNHLVLGAARHIERSYEEGPRRDEFLSILAASIPYDLLFCACMAVEVRRDIALVRDLSHFGLLRYFPDGAVKSAVADIAAMTPE